MTSTNPQEPVQAQGEGQRKELSRRGWLARGASALASGALCSHVIEVAASPPQPSAGGDSSAEPFGYCFNTSTIRGQKLSLAAQVDVVADAGYSAIEPWVGDIEQFAKTGGSLKDLAKKIRDRGLVVPSAISFFGWLEGDRAKRAAGLEKAKREMELVRQVGGLRIAAPPVGALDRGAMDLLLAAQRYRELLEIGASIGVVPQFELWGFSRSISRVGEAACVAIESAHPQACLLLDVYHLYKGGSNFESLRLLNGRSLHVLHVNDYPASPPRAQIVDAARVFPGDGTAPLDLVFRALREAGFRGYLSLEVFNRDYWKQDPHLVARSGLEKTRTAVRRAFR